MFNLLVRGVPWTEGRESIASERMFEYTDDEFREKFQINNVTDFDSLSRLPTLFMEEGTGDQLARIGRVREPQIRAGKVYFEISFNRAIDPVPNSKIHDHMKEFDIRNEFEFHRTHWAVKDINLYKVILSTGKPRRLHPKVFTISEIEKISNKLVAVMMPFDASFKRTYEAIKQATFEAGLVCKRVDEIWEDATIIQDVVSLIDQSRIVVCDCTGKNANVFYEIGIAHTLGKDVIMITQNDSDIPFDLRHHRFLHYLSNKEGLDELEKSLEKRMRSLIDR